MALVYDPDFNIMQQSHGLFAIAKLLVNGWCPQLASSHNMVTDNYNCHVHSHIMAVSYGHDHCVSTFWKDYEISAPAMNYDLRRNTL